MNQPETLERGAMLRAAIVLLVLVALSGCRGDGSKDVRSELASLRKDLRGKVDPLPMQRGSVVMPLEFERDPFRRD